MTVEEWISNANERKSIDETIKFALNLLYNPILGEKGTVYNATVSAGKDISKISDKLSCSGERFIISDGCKYQSEIEKTVNIPIFSCNEFSNNNDVSLWTSLSGKSTEKDTISVSVRYDFWYDDILIGEINKNVDIVYNYENKKINLPTEPVLTKKDDIDYYTSKTQGAIKYVDRHPTIIFDTDRVIGRLSLSMEEIISKVLENKKVSSLLSNIYKK